MSDDELMSSGTEEGYSSPEERDGNGAEPQRAIYNTDALHDKLEDISWTQEQDWAESQVITHGEPTSVDNIDDDLSRELCFYTQALSAAQQALQRFEAGGMLWRRPPDYYAEMVKGDAHMARVKQQLMHEQQLLETAEERRKQRENKRFSKEVQTQRRQEKAQARKASITDVTKLRKQRQKQGFAGELDMGDVLQQHRGPPRQPGQRIFAGQNAPSKKRQAKDARFGFGGRKRLKKQNDAVSAASTESYSAASMRVGGRRPGRAGKAGGRGRGASSAGAGAGDNMQRGKKGKPNRPGKARRAAARA